MRPRIWLLAAAAGLIMAAYALRLHHLDFESFWVDEALVLRSPLQPGLFRIGQATYAAFNAPLYWLLLTPWRQGAGESEYAVRYFSLVFSTLAVPLSFALSKRVFGRAAAWSATTLVAGNTFLIYYAQEGRMYALFAATTLASSYALVRACQRGGGGRWGLYLAAGVATAASHVFGLLAAAGQAAYLVLSQPRKARTGALTLAAFALPVAAFLVALQSPLASPL
ncbi:MAG: glycosyltransferase family 39 protein, partial [Chloroflexi bacterium]|nr:glycosyltransferase family 39 protein [Chloroflexota bacterium]